MTPRRRRLLLGGAALLVVMLVGGRWLALETAERAWAATFAGGAVVTHARTLDRLLQLFVALASVTWATAHLYAVYRTIGSVQLPRRLGDLEIVEAVPQRVLLGVTLGTGLVGGLLLSLGTGDWWSAALLAAAAPRTGVIDPILHRDVGYYLAVLPWKSTLQVHALWLTAAAVAAAALLYTAIGSLRFQARRLKASEHARGHLSLALACWAGVIAWGAALDPAEVVAGMHGDVDPAMLAVRVAAAPLVLAVAALTALVSLIWGVRDRPNLLLGGWGALLLAVLGANVVGPAIARASGAAERETLRAGRARLERQAFGLDSVALGPLPGALTTATAAATLPVWDAVRVGLVAGVPATHVTPWAGAREGRARAWLVAPAGERGGAARLAIETDTGLAFAAAGAPAAAGDTLRRFGPGFEGFVVAAGDSWPTLGRWGIPLTGFWRRAGLAWALQEPALAREQAARRMLLWRRDVTERLSRLAPFAAFGTPTPALLEGGLWWVSWGYVSARSFPLARSLAWRGVRVRYLSAALVGAVHAATGETRLWLAPGHDSLAAAWGRRFEPLVEPASALPSTLLAQLDYPVERFRLAAAQLAREPGAGDTAALRTLRPADPFELALAAGGHWRGVGVEEGPHRRFTGVLAGSVTPAGPRLTLWASPPGHPDRLPAEVVASPGTGRGDLRIWAVGGEALTLVATFSAGEAPRLLTVYVSLGDRLGEGPTPAAAFRTLEQGSGGGEGEPGRVFTDTTLAGRWLRARSLAAAADAALARGDLERFGRIWSELVKLLAPIPRPR